QSGSYAISNINQFFTGNSLLEINIGASIGSFQGKLSNRTYLAEVHLIGNAPTGVFKNGFPVAIRSSYQDLRSNAEGYFYDGNVNLLYVQITGSTDSTYQVTGEGIILSAGENIDGYPENFVLKQNFPNPFNSTTTIRYELPELANVTIKVYNILGEEVTSLVDEQKEAGRYQVQFNTGNLSSGVYIYRIDTGNFTASKKLILMK
ncbi:MAG: T9SS type A sorting domain-containing protein, partial [Bacteroidetes bacterium]|nr:T9SS type A sorting domain-containing protein [Bacteroidota bacterium]